MMWLVLFFDICSEQMGALKKSGRCLVFGCRGFEIRNRCKKRIQNGVVNFVFRRLFFGNVDLGIFHRQRNLSSPDESLFRRKHLPSPEESSFARGIFLRQKNLHQKNLPSPEEASFIRRIFLRRKKLPSSGDSSFVMRVSLRQQNHPSPVESSFGSKIIFRHDNHP